MTIIRGAFNELLRPGLKAAWDEAYGIAEKRTGVHEIFPGQLWFTDSPKTLEVPEYPPTDWPKRWWPKLDWP